MYIDPITVSYPEALDKDHFVIATYYCATKPSKQPEIWSLRN